MPTVDQIRAARALIGWNQGDLAEHSGLSQTGIARIENGTNYPNSTTIEKITAAFDAVDVEFIGENGVKKRSGEVRTLRGKRGFKDFMDDVYEVAKDQGGNIYLFNSKPMLWIKHLGQEWYDMHARRMDSLDEHQIKVRILVEDGESEFILDMAEHRSMKNIKWKEKILYGYGNKIAFLDFKNDDIQIIVMNSPEFKEYFEILFDIAWNNANGLNNN